MRFYRLLLRAFPRAFRDRFGEDMADLFSDRRRAARRRGRAFAIALWLRTAVDVVGAGWLERRGERRREMRRGMPRVMTAGDLRQAWRAFHRHPGHSAAILVTLGLGIGAATAVFAVADALMLRSLPYPHPTRLMRLYEVQDQDGFSGSAAPGNLDDWCSIAALDACGAYAMSDVNLAGDRGAPDRVRAATATPGLFDALGVAPAAGRLFTARDADLQTPVVLISDRVRRRLFVDADPLTQSLRIDGLAHDVIGVLPIVPGFDDVAVWRAQPTTGQSRNNHAFRAVARLRSGVTAAVAQEQLTTVSRDLEKRFPDTNSHWSAHLEPLQLSLTRAIAGTVQALAALVAVLVALCAASVASLVTGRALARRRELAIRIALGASRGRLVAQLFVESLWLAVSGATAGWVLARWSVAAVVAVLPPRLTLWRAPVLDGRTLAFAMLVSAGAAILFGLLPALGVVRHVGPAAGLRERFAGAAGRRTRAALVTVQTALATLLLVAAVLLGAVLARVLTRDPGFDTRDVLAFTVTPPRAAYADPAAASAFFDALTERLQRLPQVEALGGVMNVPMSGSGIQRGVVRSDEPIPQRGSGRTRLVLFQVATPGYLKALRIPLLDGRDFTAADTAAGQPVALVNQRLAAALWPGQRAIGRQLLVHTDERVPRLVVGVIADVPQARLEAEIAPEYYVPLAQSPRRSLTYVMRLRQPLTRAALQSEVSALDASLPLYDLAAMDTLVDQSTSARRAITRLASCFAAVALLLSAVALYGLVSAGVTERSREIGVRMALGATGGRIMRGILIRGVTTASIGAAAGIALAIPGIGVVRSLLTAAPPSATAAIGGVSALLMIVSLAACWIPARRALSVDPVASLRSE